jgi:hypothetical protein
MAGSVSIDVCARHAEVPYVLKSKAFTRRQRRFALAFWWGAACAIRTPPGLLASLKDKFEETVAGVCISTGRRPSPQEDLQGRGAFVLKGENSNIGAAMGRRPPPQEDLCGRGALASRDEKIMTAETTAVDDSCGLEEENYPSQCLTILTGLQSNSALNGLLGHVRRRCSGNERFEIYVFSEDRLVLVRSKNLRSFGSFEPLEDKFKREKMIRDHRRKAAEQILSERSRHVRQPPKAIADAMAYAKTDIDNFFTKQTGLSK